MSFAAFSCPQPDGYHSYLMRLRQTGPGGPWRTSLQCVQSGDKLHFASIEQLYAFLQAQTQPTGEQAPSTSSVSFTNFAPVENH